jgi:predicted transposase/invertase (TIGR01784 family)
MDTSFEEGKIEGKVEGKIEGKIEEKQSIAKGMLAEKLPLELIVKLTDLTFAEIEKLNNGVLYDE